MPLVVVTPPATTPISRTEAKLELRLREPTDLANFLVLVSHDERTGATTGNTATVQGNIATAALTVETVETGESVTVKLQHSVDNVTYEDVPNGAFPVVTPANHLQTFELAYDGDRQYLRAVGTTVGNVEWGVALSLVPVINDENELVDNLVSAAAAWAEDEILWRALGQQTLRYTCRRFPFATDPDYRSPGIIELPKPPLVSVSSVKYIDRDGVLQTMDPADYVVDVASEPGRIYPAYGTIWPTVRGEPGAVRVEYVAGYATIPAQIKAALRKYVGFYFNNRGDDAAEMPAYIRNVMAGYVWHGGVVTVPSWEREIESVYA